MLSHKYFVMERRIIVPSSSGPGSLITLLGLLDLNIRNGMNRYGTPSFKTWILNNWNLISTETGEQCSHNHRPSSVLTLETLVVMPLTNIVMVHTLQSQISTLCAGRKYNYVKATIWMLCSETGWDTWLQYIFIGDIMYHSLRLLLLDVTFWHFSNHISKLCGTWILHLA
jgi:hypothetical protein